MILYEHAERAPATVRPEDRVGAMNLWMAELEKRQRTQLRQKLDRLSQVDYEIAKDWLSGTDAPGIFKLILKSNIQLRPLACYGPYIPLKEITFLVGVIKKGGGDVRASALTEAVDRREAIRSDRQRRIPYVRKDAPKPS